MSHIIITKWKQLQLKIAEQKNEINREALIIILYEWIREFKNVKDPQVHQLYDKYLKYFEEVSKINLQLHMKPWYDFQELIEYDILNSTELTYKRPIVIVRDILWELLVFKSDKECPCCTDDNLRVMSYKDQKDLFFSCDICGCIINENGDKASTNQILYPAPFDLIAKKRIGISPI